jgi:hypothetical protein
MDDDVFASCAGRNHVHETGRGEIDFAFQRNGCLQLKQVCAPQRAKRHLSGRSVVPTVPCVAAETFQAQIRDHRANTQRLAGEFHV